MKSTVDEIRQRFDAEVERFSNLANRPVGHGRRSAWPWPWWPRPPRPPRLPPARVLDVGCGAGNYTLKLLEHLPNLDVTLVDLSRPMLDRAVERIGQATTGQVTALQGDIRELALGPGRFDVVLASAVLHHLRTDARVARRFCRALPLAAPGRIVVDFRPGRQHDRRPCRN